MKITQDLITYLEELSKLHLSEEEKNLAQRDLSELLNYMEKISEVDENNEFIRDENTLNELSNCFREDNITNIDEREEVLKNAPDKKGDYFRVHKAVE